MACGSLFGWVMTRSALWIRKYQSLQATLALERLPLALRLRESVGHRPPGAGVEAQTEVAGDDFQVFSQRIDLAGPLDAGRPGDHTVAAGIDGGGGHRWCSQQVKLFDLALNVAPAHELV